MKTFISVLLTILITTISYSQDFGEVSNIELEITQCKEQPDTDVIILFDKCRVKITHDFNISSDFHKRVKILNEEGKDYANIKFSYWNEDKIMGLDAICITPDGEEHELDSDDIFEEEGEKYNTISFAIPGVEIGSVIEYEYTHWSDYITYIEPWNFQDQNFTKLSEITVSIPPGYSYKTLFRNTEYYDLESDEQSHIDIDRPGQKLSTYRWTMYNIIGLKEEAYVNNLDEKYAQVQFILHSFKNRYNNFVFAKTWDEIAERISKSYNNFIEQDDETKDKALELTVGLADELDKVKSITVLSKMKLKHLPIQHY